MRAAVFLDRDGTINEETRYLSDKALLRLLPSAAPAIRLLNEAAMPAIVITNQAGVGRGYFSEERVGEVHATLSDLLAAEGAHVDAYYYCPHHPEARCECRKPKPALFQRAADEHQVDLSRSFAIGDKASDLEAGRRAGCRTILVLTGYGPEVRAAVESGPFAPDYVARDLRDAVQWILGQRQGRPYLPSIENLPAPPKKSGRQAARRESGNS